MHVTRHRAQSVMGVQLGIWCRVQCNSHASCGPGSGNACGLDLCHVCHMPNTHDFAQDRSMAMHASSCSQDPKADWCPAATAPTPAQLPEELCLTWAGLPPSASLKLPPPNPYIPTNFTLKRRPSHSHQPALQQNLPQSQMRPSVASSASAAAVLPHDQDGRTPSKRARTSTCAPVTAAAMTAAAGAGAAAALMPSHGAAGGADGTTPAAAADAAAAAAGASAASAAHASAWDAASEAAAEAAACKELATELGLPVVMALPPSLIHDGPGGSLIQNGPGWL